MNPVLAEPLLGNVEAELILLREENARLKMERHSGPEVAALVETVRGVAAAAAVVEDAAAALAEDKNDEAWDVLTEAMVMREVLLDVCGEIERCMLALQNRMRPLETGTLVSAIHDSARSNNGIHLVDNETLALTVGVLGNRVEHQ